MGIDFKKDNRIKEDKLKVLSPTLRVKKRFVKIKFEGNLSFEELSSKISDSVIYFMGVIDYSNSGFWILKDQFNSKEKTLILRVGVEYKDKLITSLSLMKDVEVEILRISGTLKGCNK